jgi:hypothetical protein
MASATSARRRRRMIVGIFTLEGYAGVPIRADATAECDIRATCRTGAATAGFQRISTDFAVPPRHRRLAGANKTFPAGRKCRTAGRNRYPAAEPKGLVNQQGSFSCHSVSRASAGLSA